MSMESSVACKARMPDVFPSGQAPVAPCEVLRSVRSSPWLSRLRGNPCKFAHLSRDDSNTFESQDVELSSINSVGIML